MLSLICLFSLAIQGKPDVSIRLSPVSLSSSDYQDLDAIGIAIGSARIVQLGEQTHGDGTSFEVKVRLVKYLHEKLGFNVLVWESGMIECESMNEGLNSDRPIVEVARSAVFPHWSNSKESIGVFEYARQSLKTDRPLRMSGFDIQSSSAKGNLVIMDVVKRLQAIEGLATSKDLFKPGDDLINLKPSPEKESSLLEFAFQLNKFFRSNLSKISRSIGKAATAEIEQLLKGFVAYREMMVSFARYQKSQTGAEFQIGYNIREAANAKNIEWLANKKYKGEKLIVWAHNSHVSHQGADGHFRKAKSGEVILDSTGRIVKEKFGTQMYSIGFVASGGKWSWMGNPTIPFVPSEKGSLEYTLGQSGHDLGFLDLATARSDPKDSLNLPISGYINRQNGQLDSHIWPKVFDGLIYIRDMKPRTNL